MKMMMIMKVMIKVTMQRMMMMMTLIIRLDDFNSEYDDDNDCDYTV